MTMWYRAWVPRSGEDTRRRILDRATHIASSNGLGGITIGGIAGDVGVSTGAVANHFPTMEELRLRTIEEAATVAQAAIADPAGRAEPGLPRLRAALDAWLDYLADPPFEGGCFFCTTTVEYGARPGPERDVLNQTARFGLDLLLEQTRLAQRLGEIPDEPCAEQIVFELHAYLQEANWAKRILNDDNAIQRARSAIDRRLTTKENHD